MALRPGDVRQTLDLTADDPRTLAYLKGEAHLRQPRALRLCAGDSGRLLHGLGQGFQGHCEEPLSQGAPAVWGDFEKSSDKEGGFP